MTELAKIPEQITPYDEEREAIGRLARSQDGRLLHRYLRRTLEAVVDLESDGALRAHNGRRSLARDLMRLMAEGIDERSSESSADTTILARTSGPVAVASQRRIRRDPANFPRIDSWGPAGEPKPDAKPDDSGKA